MTKSFDLGAALRRLALAAVALLVLAAPALAQRYDLTLEERTVNINGTDRPAVTVNGQFPGPLLRLREGEEAVIRVTNRMDKASSIHWHGLILPASMDGAPGFSTGFVRGIAPGETFEYRFPVVQSGTYWYHAHNLDHEQRGLYAPIVIDRREPEPFRYDRDHVVQLSEWTDERPLRVLQNLKRDPSYYNWNRRTLVDLVRDLNRAPDGEARRAIVRNRVEWGNMRMDPTDIADVTGATYRYLVNGFRPEAPATLLFRPGERVRLRFINSGAMTYFDVRIPGLRMTVVQADGNNIRPVVVDELRIAVAETYDVIVEPREDRQYQILAETMDRTGWSRARLATRMDAPVEPLPPHRPRPVLTMADMMMNPGPTGLDRGTPRPEQDQPGHVAPMGGMDHGSMASTGAGQPQAQAAAPAMDHAAMGYGGMPMGTMDHAAMGHGAMAGMPGMGGGQAAAPAMDHATMGHGAPARFGAQGPGTPATTTAGGTEAHAGQGGMAMADPVVQDTGSPPGARVLSYRDLRPLRPDPEWRPYDRIIEVRLTGNMERYIWSMNGNEFWRAQPIVARLGERLRIRFTNETMMNHPMHLHGMWMVPDLGNGAFNPRKHVVNIKPGTSLDVDVIVDAEGDWAFHCHLLYHMESGMMRIFRVTRDGAPVTSAAQPTPVAMPAGHRH
ncbi:multicopper oxidase domain-containing protein [Roseicella sp. DB1501]|uniref:multicopper oxidase domain-containing protein n=1 Tax=Roseicella sp. DB1501 TaxID=2730925 RepID=UPI0014914599|nr:multicopper oxidase domain-containing protein [Roseicella sp. DB1501]NOG73624.1 multicopper oxidase domain-containing protein [Roseicella sp. DB1501]